MNYKAYIVLLHLSLQCFKKFISRLKRITSSIKPVQTPKTQLYYDQSIYT